MRVRFLVIFAVSFAFQACTTTHSKNESKSQNGVASNEQHSGGGFLDKMEKKVDGAKQKFKEKTASNKKTGKTANANEAGFGACKSEIEKYCKASEHNYNKLFSCLKQNKAKLTPPCKAAVQSFKR